jgi:hypothetical protein
MILNDSNFLLFAAKAYDVKKSSSSEEFYEDLKRFQYLKRLFKRYEEADDLKIRLILNHIIVLYNCFGSETTHMLFFKLKDYHSMLKPFVLFLNYLPEVVEYEDVKLKTVDVPLDSQIIAELRKI